MKDLLKDYACRKKDIRARLRYFKSVYNRSNEDLFAELCFCILTPQAKATVCDEAIRGLQKQGLLLTGSLREIRNNLKGVRFPNNKAKYLIAARDVFQNCNGLDIKSKVNTKDIFRTRDWFAKNVKGLGYKEASHFLRNIGYGKEIAILDRHILRNLKRYGVLKRMPSSLTKKNYINIENKMRQFFKKLNISMEEADLLFWSKETGMIFK